MNGAQVSQVTITKEDRFCYRGYKASQAPNPQVTFFQTVQAKYNYNVDHLDSSPRFSRLFVRLN